MENRNYKLTVITPCYRLENLKTIYDSIKWEYINEWLIVYDSSKITAPPNMFVDNPKIREFVHESLGNWGNPQRNFAMDQISNADTLVYFLDDDNMIHPDLYGLLDEIREQQHEPKMYCFNQEYKDGRLRNLGNRFHIGDVDTAMILIHFNLCWNIRWKLFPVEADGIFNIDCYERNRDNCVYIDKILCYHNKIQEPTPR